MATLLDDSTVQLAQRLGASASICHVVRTERLSTSLVEVVLSGNARELAGEPGCDVMMRFHAPQRDVRRRYSVRRVDPVSDTFTLWITTDHDGPGRAWVESVAPLEPVEVIGPRGKIRVAPDANWHLFLGDVSALAAFYRMASVVTPPQLCALIVEVDEPDDILAPDESAANITGTFVQRHGRLASDPTGLLNALASFELPDQRGHAYVFGEFHVSRALVHALVDRGLNPDQISHKAFWRSGRSNADHGEPIKNED